MEPNSHRVGGGVATMSNINGNDVLKIQYMDGYSVEVIGDKRLTIRALHKNQPVINNTVYGGNIPNDQKQDNLDDIINYLTKSTLSKIGKGTNDNINYIVNYVRSVLNKKLSGS